MAKLDQFSRIEIFDFQSNTIARILLNSHRGIINEQFHNKRKNVWWIIKIIKVKSNLVKTGWREKDFLCKIH